MVLMWLLKVCQTQVILFIVQQNVNGSTDNRNANLLAGLQNELVVESTANYQEAYGLMVGQIGAITRQAQN